MFSSCNTIFCPPDKMSNGNRSCFFYIYVINKNRTLALEKPPLFTFFPNALFTLISLCQKVAEIKNLYEREERKKKKLFTLQIHFTTTYNKSSLQSSQNKLPPPCGSAPPPQRSACYYLFLRAEVGSAHVWTPAWSPDCASPEPS